VSNQIRSINYQLSNLKYIQDGWTVRPDTPYENDDLGINDDVEFNLLAQSSVGSYQLKVNTYFMLYFD
jgi:hypothetical protein